MADWLKYIFNKVEHLSGSIDNYKQDSIIQSLPSVAYVNKAKKLIKEKKLEQAQAVLKEALDISNQDSNVYKYLGKISEMKHDYTAAVEYFSISSHLNPQDKEIWLRLGMCLLNTEKFEEALGAFEHANKVTPINTDVFTGWGMAFMKLKKYAFARDKFLEAAKISKYNFTAILLSAVMEIRLGDYDTAEDKLKFLAKVAPNEGSLYEYANLKLLKNDYKEAEKYAKKTLQINKQMLPAYFILGEIYSIQKDFDKLQNAFNSAIDNGLDNEILHFEWGKAYLRFFDFDNAGKEFFTAIEKSPDFTDAKIGLALINAHSNDFELLNELREKNENNAYIQESIGLECMANDAFEDSIDWFKKALKTDDKLVYNYLNLARAYRALGNSTKTKEYFEKFTNDNPWYFEGIFEYSRWLVEVLDYADAQRKLRKAEKLAPENSEILNLQFFVAYTLVKENICEYNIKEAIMLAGKAQALGDFKYENEKAELETILMNLQGNN